MLGFIKPIQDAHLSVGSWEYYYRLADLVQENEGKLRANYPSPLLSEHSPHSSTKTPLAVQTDNFFEYVFTIGP